MSLLIPTIVLIVVMVVLFLVLGGAGTRSWVGRRAERAEQLAEPTSPTLDYVVPPGQDPVVLLTALSAEGFAAATDPHQSDLLHISCPAGPDRDRARVRATIASVHSTAIDAGVPFEPGDVRFADEP